MVWAGRELIDHLVPTLLPQAGTPSTRPGCSKSPLTWPWTLPRKGASTPSHLMVPNCYFLQRQWMVSNSLPLPAKYTTAQCWGTQRNLCFSSQPTRGSDTWRYIPLPLRQQSPSCLPAAISHSPLHFLAKHKYFHLCSAYHCRESLCANCDLKKRFKNFEL